MAELSWKGKHGQSQPSASDLQASAIDSYSLYTDSLVEVHPPTDAPAPPIPLSHGWYNRLILGDNSAVLPALLPEFANRVNLIYIDPPFMTGRDFKSGDQLAYSDKWDNDLDTYLQWLYEIFRHLHALLAHDGSLYVHLDWHVTHYARVILDEIFGFDANADGPGFKSEIIWHYQSGGRSYKLYARKHDTILLYTKSGEYCFHGERVGERRGTERRNHMRKQVGENGRVTWTIKSAGRVYTYDEDSIMTLSDVWNDISHLHQRDPERNGYATQKPAALLERILLVSSEANDLVLDCFCGSGVTPAVAEQLGRRWLACDQSSLAIHTTRERLQTLARTYPFAVQHVEKEREL